jgi:hypothetical protein
MNVTRHRDDTFSLRVTRREMNDVYEGLMSAHHRVHELAVRQGDKDRDRREPTPYHDLALTIERML